MSAASPQVSQLDSGLRVASLRMAEAIPVQVGIWVAAGARDERAGERALPICWNIWLSRALSGAMRRRSQPRWKMSAAI